MIRLAPPSFWTEPRDALAWQRALRRVATLGQVDDPRPAWEGPLQGLLPRRAIAGLYGLKPSPRPGVWLGAGLLVKSGESWALSPEAAPLVEAEHAGFLEGLTRWLVRRSPWVRLALARLASGAWSLPRGVAPLLARRALRVGPDLSISDPRPRLTLPVALSGVGHALRAEVDATALAPLHAPLYLLHALGYIDSSAKVTLPAELRAGLLPDRPADLLRRLSAEEVDAGGMLPLDRVARRLWAASHADETPRDIDAWTDRVFGEAIARGTIEVHAWAAGQPRHGRGLLGDRDRKLVRWTVHDDFDLGGKI